MYIGAIMFTSLRAIYRLPINTHVDVSSDCRLEASVNATCHLEWTMPQDIRISQLLAATHSDNFVAETIICLPLILFFSITPSHFTVIHHNYCTKKRTLMQRKFHRHFALNANITSINVVRKKRRDVRLRLKWNKVLLCAHWKVNFNIFLLRCIHEFINARLVRSLLMLLLLMLFFMQLVTILPFAWGRKQLANEWVEFLN